jgi:hypothetical protein
VSNRFFQVTSVFSAQQMRSKKGKGITMSVNTFLTGIPSTASRSNIIPMIKHLKIISIPEEHIKRTLAPHIYFYKNAKKETVAFFFVRSTSWCGLTTIFVNEQETAFDKNPDDGKKYYNTSYVTVTAYNASNDMCDIIKWSRENIPKWLESCRIKHNEKISSKQVL